MLKKLNGEKMNPESNLKVIYDHLPLLKNKKVIIEKPLACNPIQAIGLINYLIENNVKFRIGYLFKYCSWFNELQTFVSHNKYQSGIIKVHWNFFAYHYANKIDTWKKYNSQGGGVLRFYGIHLIAILIELNFNKLLYSEIRIDGFEEFFVWKAIYEDPFGKKIEINVDVKSTKTEFEIYGCYSSKNLRIHKNNPFESTEAKNEFFENDIRSLKILSLIKSFESENIETYDIYKKINQMWKQTEVLSNYIHI